MFWETLIQPVTGIINKVLDKVAADKISEAEKARLEMEAQRLAVEELQRQEEGFRKFVLEYEGSAKDMPRSIQILRGSVRPILLPTCLQAFGFGAMRTYLLHPAWKRNGWIL